MNKLSFLDELLKIGAMKPINKMASLLGEPPAGMMDPEPAPEAIEVEPASAITRLPETAALPSQNTPGTLGKVTAPQEPIDELLQNRAWEEAR